MSQNTELQKVKERIRKFSARTVERGCTESEMAEAMGRVGELLAQYNLNMGEIDLQDETCIEAVVKTTSRQVTPAGKCLVRIAELCGVKVWFGSRKPYHYNFYGMESDVEMAMFLVGLIERAVETEAAAFKKTPEWLNAYPRKSATISFYHGMTRRINKRLRELEAANTFAAAGRAKEQQMLIGSNVTSLVIIKAHVVEDTMRKAKGWVPKYTYGGSNGRVTNNSAYGSGQAAGNKVNLSRPLTSGGAGGTKMIGGY